jgi:type VI secretion system protein ImpM
MTALPMNVSITYFGKVPSRGDFVKSGPSLPLLTSLDNWLARAMDSMSIDARWKTTYDDVQPFHFAFLGSRSKLAIAGHFIASADAAHRRFPFVTAVTMEVDEAKTFVFRSPLVLSSLWSRLSQLSSSAVRSADATPDLNGMAGAPIQIDLGSTAQNKDFTEFLELQTVSSLDGFLRDSGFEGNCRQLILGLGLLLQPVMASGSNRLEKCLCLPLPIDPLNQYPVAAFWLSLINPFLQRADFELSIFFTKSRQRPVLVVGFSGASSLTLEAVLNPQVAQDHFIGFDDAQWVEEAVGSDYGVAKVASYLEQPRLSLVSVGRYFNDVFLGV